MYTPSSHQATIRIRSIPPALTKTAAVCRATENHPANTMIQMPHNAKSAHYRYTAQHTAGRTIACQPKQVRTQVDKQNKNRQIDRHTATARYKNPNDVNKQRKFHPSILISDGEEGEEKKKSARERDRRGRGWVSQQKFPLLKTLVSVPRRENNCSILQQQ